MKTPIAFILCLFTSYQLIFSESPQVIPLWEKGTPGFENRKDEPELSKDWWVRNIHNPSITVYPPPEGTANGCAVIAAPGGGFRELVFNAEGAQVAEFLNPLGITVFALKYRLPNEANSPYSLSHVKQDAYRAVRLVRNQATAFGVDPKRVGMLGFSAGGAVVMMVAFEDGIGNPDATDPIDQENGRPNFLMMVYPGGKVPRKIPADTPPLFLVCANDDEYGCDDVSMELLTKFRKAGLSVEAHMLAEGKHAFNMGDRSDLLAVRHWPQRMTDWITDRGYLKPAP